jgi:hypothetical protein
MIGTPRHTQYNPHYYSYRTRETPAGKLVSLKAKIHHAGSDVSSLTSPSLGSLEGTNTPPGTPPAISTTPQPHSTSLEYYNWVRNAVSVRVLHK